MKTKTHRLDLGRVFFPDKEFTTDKPILLKYHPEHPREGATVGYVKRKVEELHNDGTLNDIELNDINRLRMEGPDIIHNKEGLFINRDLKGKREALLMSVDESGFVIESYRLNESDLDPSMSFKWSMITDIPETIQLLGVDDLVSSERLDTVTSNTSVTLEPGDPKSPIPLEHLMEILVDRGYNIDIGDIIIKHGKQDPKFWREADGSEVSIDDYPEYFDEYVRSQDGGETVTVWNLNNSKLRDDYLKNVYGITARSYVRMR